eukprot:jgi/Hompol1/5233/HPOL_004263-RA
MAFWAGAGTLVQVWSNGLMKLPPFHRPHFHLLYAVGGAAVGYIMHRREFSRLKEIELERDMLVRRRILRNEQREAAAAAAAASE